LTSEDSSRATTPLPATRWFALADLALVVIAGGLWYNWPQLGWLPLVLALLPWGVRIAFGYPPFASTPLDLLFLLFLLTALGGVWAAYDTAGAWAKFWLILDGILLYYALAGQPRSNRWLIVGGLGAFSVALAAYFFLTHDWQAEPAKIAIINRIGLVWMRVRPTLPTHVLHPNVAGGIMAMLAPYLAAIGLRGRRKRNAPAMLVGFGGLGIVALALLATTSRGAWIALAAALGLWVLWGVSLAIGRATSRPGGTLFLGFLAALLLVGVVVVFSSPGGFLGLLNSLPGPSHVGSRLDLFRALVFLIGDFPLTGGGLDSFPGLYSQYILVSPSYILAHGHNLFLDVTLEQGIIGGLLNLAILVASGWVMIAGLRQRGHAQTTSDLVIWAALAGLVTMMIHGGADDILYGSRASLLIWVSSGVAVGVLGSRSRRDPREGQPARGPFSPWVVALIVAALLGGYGFIFRNALGAAWQANLGAVEMARVELAFFPTDKWDDGSRAEALRPSAARFESALALAPGNRTARHRLGLAALLFRDFGQAVAYLEAAHQLDPQHPGITKALAYGYVWDDRPRDAFPLLTGIPEAREEMGIYVFWWRGLGRQDLSDKAAMMADQLGQIPTNQKDSPQP